MLNLAISETFNANIDTDIRMTAFVLNMAHCPIVTMVFLIRCVCVVGVKVCACVCVGGSSFLRKRSLH